MQQLTNIQQIMQRPLVIVLGVLAGAAAAKSGHGAWAAAGILAYFGAAGMAYSRKRLLRAAFVRVDQSAPVSAEFGTSKPSYRLRPLPIRGASVRTIEAPILSDLVWMKIGNSRLQKAKSSLA